MYQCKPQQPFTFKNTDLQRPRYLIGQTVGGIFCSPLSETFGRRTLYVGSCISFCAFNAIIAAIHSTTAVYIGRFITGLVAAVPATVAFGNFDDLFAFKTRIWIVYLYTTLGNFGLVLGPIYGSYITAAIGWRWVFYIATIASGVSAVAFMAMDESRATSLLNAKVSALRRETGNQKLKPGTADNSLTLRGFFMRGLFRPLFFLVSEPLVTFCAILCSIAYGLIYGATESLTIVYESFGFSQTASSLPFIALLVGLILDVIPRIYDHLLLSRFHRQNRKIVPETKIRSFALACPALALGLWLFAWTVPPLVPHVHWLVSLLGLVLVGFSANDFAHVLFGYMTDSYGAYAASAVSALSLSRTLVAAAFPLFTSQMYSGLGSNVAGSILAGTATLFALTPFLFLRFGRRWRGVSTYAVDDDGGDEGEVEKGKEGDVEASTSTETSLREVQDLYERSRRD